MSEAGTAVRNVMIFVGLLIVAALGPSVVLFAITWPTGYHGSIGHWNEFLVDMASGGLTAGLCLALFILARRLCRRASLDAGHPAIVARKLDRLFGFAVIVLGGLITLITVGYSLIFLYTRSPPPVFCDATFMLCRIGGHILHVWDADLSHALAGIGLVVLGWSIFRGFR